MTPSANSASRPDRTAAARFALSMRAAKCIVASRRSDTTFMNRNHALTLLLAAALPFTGCKKLGEKIPFLKKKETVAATPAPVVVAATPAPETKPAAPALPEVNTRAAVMVLCYHRFEDRPKDSLAINPAEFEKQMQALKDHGFTVIKMTDFLAWRRSEKSIPDKSCIISIDDGYRSGYEVAWPILKKFGYPFTMFIYTNFVKGQPNAGGQSLSWEELAEMRDAGVDIESHSISHSNLREKKGKWQNQQPNYEAWLTHEICDSKKMLEKNLGISVKAFAYPYGNHNEEIRRVTMDAGYEAAFTVYGQRLSHGSAPDQLGRYAIESKTPKIFEDAIKMAGGGGGGAASGPYVAAAAASSMVTQPLEGEVVTDPMPTIKANLATLGEIDPKSVEMRISGFGPVPVKYDPATKTAEYKVAQKLREPSYSVFISAKAGGKKIEAKWNFTFDPTGTGAASPADAPLPARAATPAPVKAPATPKKKK